MENNYYEKNIIIKLGCDAKFVGLLNIIIGVLNCLSLYGIPSGVLTIITGMKAKDAGNHFQNYATYGDEAEEYRAIENLGNYFKWMKISIIVGIVIMAIVFIISLSAGGSLFKIPKGRYTQL